MKETNCAARAREAFSRIEVSEALQARAEENLARWLEEDEFLEARPQLEHLIESGSFTLLFDAFFQDIPFGTGGRRGPVGFGTNRINAFTVSTSIEGHARFLKTRPGAASSTALSVVVAFDVRVFKDLRGVYDPKRPNPLLGMTSRDFAKIAASVYAANGIRVWMPDPSKDRYISTPELSFAIRSLKAQGGLNMSASHNHPDDNGAKIYNDKGSQAVPPEDEELARLVEATGAARSMPFEEARRSGLVEWIPAEVFTAYLETNAGVSRDRRARSARVVFTPLHGTGLLSAGASLTRAGFDMVPYPEQSTPDGTFPNVPFRSPNPEVRESLTGATKYARARAADLVLGTDPDADRIGMVAPHRSEWTFFTGNEIGVLLAHYLLAGQKDSPRGGPAAPPAKGFAVTTVVTTSLFSRIARRAGVHVIDDLGVGFKYIADVLNSMESSGSYRSIRGTVEDFVIGIEESHGYLVVPSIRDKDAAGAAVLLAEIASQLKEQGKSFTERLDEIYKEYGYVKNLLVSTVMLGARGFVNMKKIQESLRARPPGAIGGRKVIEVMDRWSESGPLGKIVSETDRMSRDLLIFSLEGNARVILRPSGTESKNKVYVEASGEPLRTGAPDSALADEKQRIDAAAKRIAMGFWREMLSRIDVELPDHAFEVSDLVALENKQDFALKFLPEIRERLERGERGPDLDRWVEMRLKPYGADARLLVAPAVMAYLEAEKVPDESAAWLRSAFERKS
ncbi:MAG TPA: phospho-sugar mutase [Planctomycetota bacterium]|nr:phospho-sugar mutase [Planctomycetota bacterium]